MSQNSELVDASARLPFLLHVKSHVPVVPNPGPGWKQDVSGALMKSDRVKACSTRSGPKAPQCPRVTARRSAAARRPTRAPNAEAARALADQLNHAMPKRRKINPALKRLLIREFPDIELDEVIKLLDMGLLRLKRVRCAAFSRNPRRPCAAQALFLSPGTSELCRHHGGIPKSEAGRKASDAQKRRWAKWRAEGGEPTMGEAGSRGSSQR